MSKDKHTQVFHFDLQGKRDDKYDFLSENSLSTIDWNLLEPNEPNFFFVKKNFDDREVYEIGFKMNELFPFKTSGVKTHDDKNLVSDNHAKLEINVNNLNYIYDFSKVLKYSYRPFDIGYIYYDPKILGRAREKTIYHLKHKNIGLILVAQPQAANLNYFDCLFLTNCITDTNMYRRGGPSAFPLYLYPDAKNKDLFADGEERVPNLNMEIVEKIEKNINHTFLTDENIVCDLGEGMDGHFSPLDILDYIYAVLHSPTYREKYKEFLKIDFPRVPYPKDAETFWQLVNLGGEIRQIHLLESPKVEQYITQYPEDGDNVVGKPKYQDGKVFINDTQYFDNVPQVAWDFYIGGYQPAQKWLKDRKDRKLEFDDILHYQKIIVALSETDRLMKEIDKIEIN